MNKLSFIVWCLLLRLAPLPPALGQVPPYEEKAETVLNSGCLKLTQQGIYNAMYDSQNLDGRSTEVLIHMSWLITRLTKLTTRLNSQARLPPPLHHLLQLLRQQRFYLQTLDLNSMEMNISSFKQNARVCPPDLLQLSVRYEQLRQQTLTRWSSKDVSKLRHSDCPIFRASSSSRLTGLPRPATGTGHIR